MCFHATTEVTLTIGNIVTTAMRRFVLCHGFDATLTEIEHAVNEAIFPTATDKDEAIYQMKSAKLAILTWKHHILKSHNQDQARHDVLDQLDEKMFLFINNWAMNFLPQKYRTLKQIGVPSEVRG